MTANNCDDTFQQLQRLQEQKQALQRQLEEKDRLLRAAGVYQPSAAGNGIILRDLSGAPVELDPAEIQRGYIQLVGTMNSREVDELASRGLEQLARPVGSEGRFQNYDRLIKEVDVSTREDYARFAEALGLIHRRIAPEDHAFITRTYGKDKLIELVSGYYRNLGASDPEILAQAAAKSAPMMNAVENKMWLRFWADRSKRLYLDSVEEMQAAMREIPGSKPPPEMQQEAFRRFRLALLLERHNNLVTRRHAQALRSQQENILDLQQFRLDLGDESYYFEPGKGIDDAIGMTGKDVAPDEHFGRVIEAIDNGDANQLSLLIDAAKIDGLDPKSRLDKDWFNTHMRMATALVKDSQLSNLNSNYLNVGSNGVMMLYGPLQQTFYNGSMLTPMGTRTLRNRLIDGSTSLLEAMRISGEAHNFAMTALKATWKSDLQRVFQTGVSHYSGNLDTYGKRLLTNQQELQDMQAILDMPYRPGANWFTQLGNPHNVGIFTNKLQAAARILVLTKPNGAVHTGMNRGQAAIAALGFGKNGGVQRISARDIDMYLPWKPALRAMAGVDEVAGRYHYLFKLKADLEVKARMEGAQLGLLDDRSRAEWVQRQIDEAVYQATPSENDIKAFRKQHGLKGSDFTDDEIGALISESNLAGAPTLSSPESIEALRHSAEMRFQDPPTGNPGEVVDTAMMGLRRNWMVDGYVMPYWRSLFAGTLLDWRLSTFGIVDTVKMLNAGGFDKAPPELVARVKASWTMSGALLAAFGALDAAGQVGGGADPDPDRRNTIFGMKLGGFPVVNTLLLWKDIKDTAAAANTNDYDGTELLSSIMKLLTAQITRTAGVQQIQLLLEALMDGNRSSMERLQTMAGFIGSGQIPFIGTIRNVERAIGRDRNSYYRDEPSTAAQRYELGQDHPLKLLEQSLRSWLIDTMPIAAGLAGARRKETDHLGTPRGHIFGVNLSKAFPMFFPSVWPKGKTNQVVYAELDAQNMLDPPRALLSRVLEGVSMSDDLQFEYNDIHGTIEADPRYPLMVRLGLSDKATVTTRPQTFEAVPPTGQRTKETDSSGKIEYGPLLNRVTRGRTKKDALYALFTSPEYQQLEDDPVTSAHPPGGLPRAQQRTRAAQVLIQRITDYYDLLTQDELERRAAAGTSAAAKEWSDTKTALTAARNRSNLTELQRANQILSGSPAPAQ